MPTAARTPPRWLVVSILALLCAIWGSTYLVIRTGLEDLPPFRSASLRFLAAGSILALLAPLLAHREGGARPGGVLTVAMGLCNVAIPYGLVYWSETILPSGLVSVLWAVFPLLMAISSHAFLPHGGLTARQWLGFVTGFGGVLLLFLTDLAALGSEAIPAGLLLLLSPASYSVGATVIKRTGEGTSSMLLNRNGLLVGGALLGMLALWFEQDAQVRWTRSAVFSIGYLTLVGTVVTFSGYFWLMRYASAAKLSLIAYVIPLVALTLGALWADEPVGWWTIAGTALILSGVALVGARRPGR